VRDLVEYKLVSSLGLRDIEDTDLFEQEVNRFIRLGYKPIGGISIRMGSNSGAYFLQSMVKEFEK
jgi:hypothetical protein